jgi:hypothetical protein
MVDDWVEETIGMDKYRDTDGIDDKKYDSYKSSDIGNIYSLQ